MTEGEDVLMSDEGQGVVGAVEYHDGALYGIRHPGTAQGCPFCASTLAQRDMIARWLTPTEPSS